MAEEKKEVNETFLASLFLVLQDNNIKKKQQQGPVRAKVCAQMKRS